MCHTCLPWLQIFPQLAVYDPAAKTTAALNLHVVDVDVPPDTGCDVLGTHHINDYNTFELNELTVQRPVEAPTDGAS